MPSISGWRRLLGWRRARGEPGPPGGDATGDEARPDGSAAGFQPAATAEEQLLVAHPGLVRHRGTLKSTGRRTPAEARAENLATVAHVLDAAGIPYVVVRKQDSTRTAVAVQVERADEQVAGALVHHLGGEPVYVSPISTDGASAAMVLAALLAPQGSRGVEVFRVWRFHLDELSGLVLGRAYACDIEIWMRRGSQPDRWVAPRDNVAARELDAQDLAPVELELCGRTYPTGAVFTKRMIDDVDFPIDAVYSWVDGADPVWRSRMGSYRLSEHPNPDAAADYRYRSRDELRFSLRSLEMYAPWLRQIYVVTDRQRPSFLLEDPRVRVVDHAEIATDPSLLPVFSNRPILTWLHRIEGLSEHFLYLNDDFFVGRDVHPSTFFLPSGIAKAFPSRNRRSFGPLSPTVRLPDNLARMHRLVLERSLGRTLSRLVRHTPQPMIRSVCAEMEDRFAADYERTRRSRFRHHEDIAAEQLFHYYAQITARAVPASIGYTYVNLGDEADTPILERLLDERDSDVFCLNDDPAPDRPSIPDELVDSFLRRYFPIPAAFERDQDDVPMA